MAAADPSSIDAAGASPFAGGPTLKDVLERANKLSKQVEQLSKFIQSFPTQSPLLSGAGAKAAPAEGDQNSAARIAELERENAELRERLEQAEMKIRFSSLHGTEDHEAA
ncbi:hypothetical protein M427DRAFT_56880 [Gonapodya prolifera JEL478]|uniref:Uncharacterized protein n=1 Tax=Gonapodya prolifera (strain JEL478) TaxID=1344416 RepID=A0A139AFR5_GONPJ|nr:hypothetical protein M427DRAFT_56880 [Gonapodya prolifera JEL478]|eukprot:KXS15253.1 hypothetical protein M427DRAFT_56880 [Gonapodya prolifera JEL478]